MKTVKNFVHVFMAVVTALLVLNVATLQAQTPISDWGRTTEGFGNAWPHGMLNDANTPVGNASITGVQPMPGGTNGASLRGGFGQDITIPSDQALVVRGQLEYVGGGMGSVYTPLRYAITYMDSLTLRYQYTDSAQWAHIRAGAAQNHHYGYEFTPRSSTGVQPNGSGGSGSVWGIRNGNWASTFSNGGGIIGPVVNQAPRNAEITVGTYDWAISVQAINDTTNEVRWSLVKTDNSYWFGGSVNAPALTDKLNGVAFWIKDGTVTQFNILDAQVDLGDPIAIPEAPFEAYYLDQWGRTTEGFGNAWPHGMRNDANTPVGNASITGVQPMPGGTNGASLRGGFGQDITIPSDQALVVRGQLEYVGGGMGSVYTPLRYAITYMDSLTLRYQYTDSAQWAHIRAGAAQNHHYGYEFTPRSSTGVQPNGSGGSGSVWGIVNGNWASTFSNGGGIVGPVVNQAPRNAEISAGTYNWAISVQAINDTTNEVRWSLVKTDNRYWFGGSVMARAVTHKLNGVAFWFKDGAVTQFNILDAQIDLGDPIKIPEAPFEAYYLDQWGRTTEGFGNAWPHGMRNDANTPVGNASITGVQPMPGGTNGASLRGGFGQDITIPSDKALVVRGQLEYVGGGMGSVYTPLRYAITYMDSLTLRYQYTDSAQWAHIRAGAAQNHHYGYEFTPRSSTGVQPNGAGGSGSVWGVNNGNWASTFSNNGGIIGPVVNQAPRNAEISAGTYNWAISVQAINDTTNEVRWSLVKTDNKYWFGGSVRARAVTHKLNGVAFWFKDGAVTQFNILDAQIDLGDPIKIPEAPFEAYYLDQWGRTTEGFGNAWPHGMRNDANTPVGNATIAGVQPMPAGTNGASLRGGFGQDITIPSNKAVVVWGQLEYVGGGQGSVYTPLRYAITYLDSLTLRYQYTDSAQWAHIRAGAAQNHHYGYEFTPRSSTGVQPNGAGGSGSVWGVNNGNWASTFSNNGGIIGPVVNQAPRNAEISAGTYDWAISVQAINDTTNEVRWSLVKTDNKYWFGGSVMARAVTHKLNGVAFWFKDGAVTQFNILDAQIDLGDPIEVPPAPFEAYYAENWGVIGNRFGGWKFTPGDVSGNATISGSAPNTGLAAVRSGFFEPITPPKDKALIVTGQMEFVGGGFQAANSLRFGVFYSDSAGTVISTPVDSTRWSGTERANSGYLFLPQSGSNGPVDWQANQKGTWGAVVKGPWLTPGGANNYALGSQLPVPANAVGGAGTYDFAISVAPQENGTTEVRFKLIKSDKSYSFYGKAIDNHNPLVTTKFNSVAFALGAGNTTTAMKLIDVYVDLGTPIDIPTSVNEGTKVGIPTEYVLDQNYPNPFNPTTTIDFGVPQRGEVKLIIYDIAGRVVAELAAGNFDAGYYSINFDATHLASGIYYYKLKAGDFVSVKKLMLLK